ncbi:UNVERIFIED_CONTAM: hypothetical protein RMT77_010422 [Armadillidium vulgare]
MQPSWFTVPWVQFQTFPGITGLTAPNGGQMGAALGINVGAASPLNHPHHALTSLNNVNGFPTLNSIPSVNGFNGMTSLNLAAAGLNSINGLNGLNGINNMNGLSSIGGINGLTAGPGGLVAFPGPSPNAAAAAAAAPPGLTIQLRRPHQPVPPPLAALIRGKKEADLSASFRREKRKAEEDFADNQDIKKAKLETKALKAKRPGFSEERYNETSYYIENGLRKVYPYYFTFTTFTKGRWVGEKIIDVFAKEFRAHPAQEYERCIKSGTLTVNYEKVDTDYRLKHNDLLANIVHRHETPVLSRNIEIIHLDEDLVVLDKPCSLPVHPCGRYRHNTVVFILAKEYNLKNLRTIHRLDRLTSGLLLFGRTPKKAREMEQQIRTRQVTKEYVCRVEGEFPTEHIECNEPIEVVSYKIGVCKVSPTGKDCRTEFKRLTYNGKTSVVLCRPHTGRMHQIRVHLQFLGYPIVNDPLYNHNVFGPLKGKGGIVGKTDEELIQDLIKIHNAENWLGMDGDSEYSMFKARQKEDGEDEGSQRSTPSPKSPKEKSSPAPRIVSPPTITSTGVIIPSPEHTSPNSPASMDDPKNQGVNFNGTRIGIGATPEEIIKAAQDQQQNPRDYTFRPQLMTFDPHCYECKVKYRDPKPKDLVMFLHALKYSGPGWHYETKLPEWASETWTEDEV